MRAAGGLTGTESVSLDGKVWQPIGSLPAPAPSAESSGERDEISLPAIELGRPPVPPTSRTTREPSRLATPPPPIPAAAAHASQPASSAVGSGLEWDGAGLETDALVSLELDDHRTRPAGPARSQPPPGGRPSPPSPVQAARRPTAATSAPTPPVGGRSSSAGSVSAAGPPRLASLDAATTSEADADDAVPRSTLSPIGTEASAAVAALLEGEAEPAGDPTARVLLDSPAAPSPVVAHRPRTLTAARPEPASRPGHFGRGLSRRQAVLGVVGLVVVAGAALTYALDLPERIRGEPSTEAVLSGEALPSRPTDPPGGPPRSLAAELAQDRYAAYLAAASRLQEAAARRKRAPETRAAAAELLAQAVVLHGGDGGGDRARLDQARALLDSAHRDAPRATPRIARAEAWLALARGRWKEAEAVVNDPTPSGRLSAPDQSVVLGWAAFGRGDFARAAQRFDEAVRAAASPAAPGLVATRFALGRAHEGGLAPAASGDYRAVLALAPTHLGASLGEARLSPLPAAARAKLAKAALQALGRDAAPFERADGFAFLARSARQADDAAESEAALGRARAASPGHPTLAVLDGDMLLDQGRTEEAIARYRSALTAPLAAPVTPQLRCARAAALLESGRTSEAQVILLELARRLPTEAASVFWLGRMAERGVPPDSATAERRYREALGRDARFVPAVLQLARLLIDGHRPREALDVLEAAEAHGASATATRLALGEAQLGAGNASAAATTFRQLLAQSAHGSTGRTGGGPGAGDPGLTAAHLGLATAWEATGNLDGARKELGAITTLGRVEADPQLAPRVAALLARLGQRQEALTLYEKQVAAGQATPVTRIAAARLALLLGKRSQARSLAAGAVDDDPRTPGGLLLLAEISRLDGNTAQAVAELKRAVAVDASPEVQLELGRALAMLGRDEEALTALAEAAPLPAAGIERGRILVRRGDFEGGASVLSAALARLPGNGEAFLWLGIAEDRLGQVAAAEAAWRSAVRLSPTSSEARYRLGRLEMEHGQPAAALRELRAAAGAETLPAEGGWRADLFFQLGFAEKRQGSPSRALAAFRRYLELAPPDAPARAEVTSQLAQMR
jgi:tetratricopeptide (TPR) repeat protein